MLGAPRAAFVPSGPFVVVARNFVYAGRSYAKGEPFTGTSDRHELFALWNGLKLDMAPQLAPAQPGTIQTATVQMPGCASTEIAQQLDRRERRFNKHRR